MMRYTDKSYSKALSRSKTIALLNLIHLKEIISTVKGDLRQPDAMERNEWQRWPPNCITGWTKYSRYTHLASSQPKE